MQSQYSNCPPYWALTPHAGAPALNYPGPGARPPGATQSPEPAHRNDSVWLVLRCLFAVLCSVVPAKPKHRLLPIRSPHLSCLLAALVLPVWP